MKISPFWILILFASVVNGQAVGFLNRLPDFIENTSVFELNQEEGRAYFIPQKSLSLNGTWKFQFSDIPDGIPQDFFQPGFNDSKWGTVPVPGNWEMHGYGDPLFRNVSLSFTPNPPLVPDEYNPSGAYRTTFTIPSTWKGDQVFLRFEKAASASFVWINGKEVGYNEGGQEPSEYNVTQYLKPGRNNLAVAVVKFSDGYYLEDQDYWRLAGIFDDVWLYAAPATRLFDWQVITDLDSQYKDAILKIIANVKNYGNTVTGPLKVRALVTRLTGQKVAEFSSGAFSVNPSETKPEILTEKISNPEKWTAESPVLYNLNLHLVDPAEKIVDQSTLRIGFKETEIRGDTFFLNGVPIKVNAQNSHMQHPENGHVMDEQTIRKDFEILKQFNFNAVRTSHYPPVNKYLELADEYGLYIIDEAGTEAHSAERVSQMPEFTKMYKERARKMVLRDRNHPCILFWSAGNESGNGFNITEVVKEGKRLDPTRYWMYGGNADVHPAEDIIGPRYPTPIELDLRIGTEPDPQDIRPSFMDEYLAVTGNGGGGLDDYWRVIWSHPRTMGGAIWDFVSTGITRPVRQLTDGSPFHTPAHLMGNARLVDRGNGKVLDLNGHDQWVEVYRKDNVEIAGDQLMLTCDIFPRKLIYSSGTILTKGSYQFGLKQIRNDSLEFCIYTNKPYRIRTLLPKEWLNNWHHLLATYDGKMMRLIIDGKEAANGKAEGKIRNFPFPVNIGRDAEIHGQDTRVYLCDALIDNVGIFSKVVPAESLKPENAALWLDFETETNKGNFYSYGIGARTYGSIWPNRVPQPEMWQMKKSVQPVSITWIDAGKGLVEVWNRNAFLPVSHYLTTWKLQADGEVIQQGELSLQTAPLSKEVVRIPYTKPYIHPGKEYRITVSSVLRKDEIWAKAGYEVAWDQLELPWYLPAEEKTTDSSVRIEKRDEGELVVSGNKFTCRFDLKKGELVSILTEGKELLKEGITMNAWRAPLANEQDQWNAGRVRSARWKTVYGNHAVTEMYSAGLDELTRILLSTEIQELEGKVYVSFREISLLRDDAVEQKDAYIKGRACNGFENNYRYVITGNEIILSHSVNPQGTMPQWLPRIGITMSLNKDLNVVRWYGRGPQENYPDRKTGYPVGIFQSTIDQMVEPYLLPQDFGLRTDNRWVSLTDENGTGLRFSVSELFNFNAYPFSTENLTKAMFTYQLEKQDGITFNLDYATSGVGCTARSIFPGYRVYPQRYEREIRIIPVGT